MLGQTGFYPSLWRRAIALSLGILGASWCDDLLQTIARFHRPWAGRVADRTSSDTATLAKAYDISSFISIWLERQERRLEAALEGRSRSIPSLGSYSGFLVLAKFPES